MKTRKQEVTRETVLAAVKAGAKTVGAVASALGVKPGGNIRKKIKAAVPQIEAILKGGTPVSVGGHDVVIEKGVPIPEKGKAEKGKEVVRTAKKVRAPYLVGGMAQTIVETASKEISVEDCDRIVAEKTGKELRLVQFCRRWVANQNHKSNRGTRNVAAEKGKIRIEVFQPVAAG